MPGVSGPKGYCRLERGLNDLTNIVIAGFLILANRKACFRARGLSSVSLNTKRCRIYMYGSVLLNCLYGAVRGGANT